ncbi:Hsp20/alpha crystallin family protein [Streptomyces sp. NPDC006530]|uniref:Hsp20/alpha crystallin family protein n=1 Tax=Streptomyces sp. NPDC006530 TaxID=3364750 RepID=UPI00369326AE
MIERLPGWPLQIPELFSWVEAGLPSVPGLHNIRIEESFTEGIYTLRAELPGIDPDHDVELTVTEGVLTLRAERRTETTDKHHTEFRYGTFARSVRLPAGAQGDEATAECKDGVLTITVPVPEPKASTRTISVRRTLRRVHDRPVRPERAGRTGPGNRPMYPLHRHLHTGAARVPPPSVLPATRRRGAGAGRYSHLRLPRARTLDGANRTVAATGLRESTGGDHERGSCAAPLRGTPATRRPLQRSGVSAEAHPGARN